MNLFGKLAASAEKAMIHKTHAKRLLRCPECGEKPTHAPVDAETLMHCASCGQDTLPINWRPGPRDIFKGHPDRIPAGTRIRREGQPPGDCIWHIPATGKFGFFLFFGGFWTAITAIVSFGFLFGSNSADKPPEPWFIYPFFGIFWAIGLGMLYAAVRNKYARHRITVTRDQVTLRRELLGKVKEKSLITQEITSVEQTVFYQQNYQAVYGVEIRSQKGKLRFGSVLTADEKAWLVADIRRAVSGDPVSTFSHIATPALPERQRQSSFSFPLPPAPKWHWLIGLILVLIGLGGLVMGIFFNDFPTPTHGKEATHWIELIFSSVFGLFNLIPIIVGLIFGAVGLSFMFATWRGREQEVRLEANESQVALRTYQHGRMLKEQSFPRSSVSEIRSTRSGEVNGKPMKRIDLIVDGKAKRITRWTNGDVADGWVTDVRSALGH